MAVKPGSRITEMYAFVTVDPEDDVEGIISVNYLPLVGADTDRVEGLKPAAQLFADKADMEVEVIRFTLRERITTIKPGS